MNNTKISRRSFLAAAGIAGAAAALTACGSSASSTAPSVAGSAAASSEAAGGSMELIVFAAASLTETLTAIGEIYSAENPGVTFSFNFDSSGTLKTQIQEGADCDLFISAGQKQMNQLDSTASADLNTEGLDFVDSDSRVDLLENKVVLCVPENGDKGIDSFDSLAEHLKAGDILFCMGNSDVPVGQYTQKILAYYALDEEALAAAGVITYGSNVKEVTTQITEASVDAGVVYCTDAYSAGLTPVDEATKEMCGQVIYPAAVLKAAPQRRGCQGVSGLSADRPRRDRVRERGLHRTVNPLFFRASPGGSLFIRRYHLWTGIPFGTACASPSSAARRCSSLAFLPPTILPSCRALSKARWTWCSPCPWCCRPRWWAIFCYFCSAQSGRWVPFFMEHFGVKLVMNWYSAIFASIVVAFPLMYRTARGAFESFDETLAWSAQTLGQSDVWIFWRVRMPCCRQGILAGTVLAFARALGEYGATSMIAGYTPGKTATIATTVYQLWRTNDEAGAMRWVLVDIVISAVVLLAVNLLEKKQKAGGRA